MSHSHLRTTANFKTLIRFDNNQQDNRYGYGRINHKPEPKVRRRMRQKERSYESTLTDVPKAMASPNYSISQRSHNQSLSTYGKRHSVFIHISRSNLALLEHILPPWPEPRKGVAMTIPASRACQIALKSHR